MCMSWGCWRLGRDPAPPRTELVVTVNKVQETGEMVQLLWNTALSSLDPQHPHQCIRNSVLLPRPFPSLWTGARECVCVLMQQSAVSWSPGSWVHSSFQCLNGLYFLLVIYMHRKIHFLWKVRFWQLFHICVHTEVPGVGARISWWHKSDHDCVFITDI